MNKRNVPPYKSFVLITSSPGLSSFIIASIAAKPDENATPCLAFSRLANEFCKAVLVGL